MRLRSPGWLGEHTFDFQVGDGFFEQVEDTEITAGQVSVVVEMAREERMMDLHFQINGKVTGGLRPLYVMS